MTDVQGVHWMTLDFKDAQAIDAELQIRRKTVERDLTDVELFVRFRLRLLTRNGAGMLKMDGDELLEAVVVDDGIMERWGRNHHRSRYDSLHWERHAFMATGPIHATTPDYKSSVREREV